MVVLSIFPELFFYVNNTSFCFHWHLFFYFISNNNCQLLTIHIVSFIFFYYRESKPPFCFHYEKSSPVNIVYRKINWQNPASISAYTQSEYSISNYVNHIRIVLRINTLQIIFLMKSLFDVAIRFQAPYLMKSWLEVAICFKTHLFHKIYVSKYNFHEIVSWCINTFQRYICFCTSTHFEALPSSE
jgi:hypothetical protein